MFSASACNGSNNGSGAWRWKQYGAGSGDREESDDPLYDAVKLGLDNTSGTVLGRHLCSKWKYNIENTDGTEIPGWGGAKGFFMSKGNVVCDTTEYTLSVKGTFTGFQFLDFANPGNNINP